MASILDEAVKLDSRYYSIGKEVFSVEKEKKIDFIGQSEKYFPKICHWRGEEMDIPMTSYESYMSERELPRVKFVRSHAIAARHIYWTLDTSLGIGFPGHCRYIR